MQFAKHQPCRLHKGFKTGSGSFRPSPSILPSFPPPPSFRPSLPLHSFVIPPQRPMGRGKEGCLRKYNSIELNQTDLRTSPNFALNRWCERVHLSVHVQYTLVPLHSTDYGRRRFGDYFICPSSSIFYIPRAKVRHKIMFNKITISCKVWV